jgi:3-dehydroquinate dehydratase / shikimate dehydrogenase
MFSLYLQKKKLMTKKCLETKRLILRHWEDVDYLSFYKMNSNPKVMEFFPFTLTKKQSDFVANRITTELSKKPYGFWAVALKTTGKFMGFIGIHYLDRIKMPFTPCMEIGWRLDVPYWGKGYATEGAKCALEYGHKILKFKEIIAITPVINQRSRRVMEKLNMEHFISFFHPKIPQYHRLSRQVLYRSKSENF